MADRVGTLLHDRRLAALAETGLIGSPADDSFDRFTRLVTRTLGIPISLVTFVDTDRQFFKAELGLPEPWSSARGTPLTHSFCQHVVANDEPLVIPDARDDPRVCDNLAIADLGVVAYAGFPLRTPEGVPLGSLCAIDTVPHDWSEEDLAALADLANAVNSEIGLRLAAVRQRAFAANASHQLRGPLTALRLELESLEFAADDAGAVRRTASQLVEEVDRLADTVTALLELARDDRFGHEREADLAALLGRVAVRWRPLAVRHGREIVLARVDEVHEVVPVAAFTQIVEVLVENALEHGRGTVTLELRDEGPHVRLHVRDEGEGVGPRLAARILERDERGPHSRGEGIGLSLADEIARRVGGRLLLLPGAPTTFELLLPRR
jgi:signal transduction histidine kinase